MINEDKYQSLKQQLERKEKVEKVLIETSIQFSRHSDFDEAMNVFLENLLNLTGVERVYVTMIENGLMNVTHEVTLPGLISRKKYIKNYPYREMEWFKDQHMSQGYVAINSLKDFPENAVDELKLYKLSGTQASLIKSFVSKEFLKGFITLEQSTPRANWEPEFIQLLNFGSVLIEHTLERKSVEKLLVEAKEKAEESDRLKSAFVANLSHEIRTPLNAIVGFSELLTHNRNNENKSLKYTRIIEHNSKQLISVISDILDIARIESGVIELNETDFDLYHFLQDLFVQHYESSLKTSETQLILTVSDDEHVIISVDIVRLKQVLDNLIKNALKFTDSGYVKFGYKLRTDCVEFFVKDTGIGINPQNFKSIFERFNQVDNSGARAYGGNGLGLSICQQLVWLMGGDIWLESEVGTGTIFYFTIPLKIASTVTEKKTNAIAPNFLKNITNKHFLIVDDTDDCRVYLQIVIESVGGTCISLKDSCEAIFTLTTHSEIDVVLLDIQLPGCEGEKLLQEIKALKPNLPVIAVTAHAMSGDKEKYLNMGFDAYVAKPVSQDELFDTILQFC